MAAAAAFTGGLLLPAAPSLWLPLGLAGLAVLTTFVLQTRRVLSEARAVLLLLAFLLLGWGLNVPTLAPTGRLPSPSDTISAPENVPTLAPTGRMQLPSERVWVEGTVRIAVDAASDHRTRYRLSLHRWWAGQRHGDLDLGAVLYLPDSVALHPGEDVRLIARLDTLTGPRNPGDFNARGYWANRDVHMRLRHVRAVEPLGVQRFWGGWTRHVIGGWRAGMEATIDRHLTPTTAPLARALLTGDRSAWDDTLRDQLARSGLMHLFAISGLHVALLLGIALSALSLLGQGPRITALLALPLLWLLVPLTGSNPPVVRATVILSAVLIGRGLQRDSDPFHLLALSYILLLAWRPAGLADPGFQLSFAGAAGSLWAARHFQRILVPTRKYAHPLPRTLTRWGRQTALAFLVSIFAWLATAPIIIAHFGRLALLGPLATLPALLLVTLALTAGWVMLLTAWWPGLASLYGTAMDLLLRATDAISHAASPDPIVIEHLSLADSLLAALILAVVLAFTRYLQRAPVTAASHALLSAAVIVVLGSTWLPDPAVKLAVLDVGQGDGILLRSGDRVVLIDGGTPYSTAAADQCRRLGIDHLDLVLLSHGDADHAGALPRLLETVSVGAVLTSPATARDAAGAAALAACRERSIPVYVASAGVTVTSPVGRFTCLHPSSSLHDPTRSDNAQSLVWLWDHAGASAVFAGDIPAVVEQQILASRPLPDIDLLLAGHHGSRSSTSTAWLAALNPETVAISCGRHNPHGHPHPDVLSRLTAHGATVHRTDRAGALLYHIVDGSLEPLPWRAWW